MYILTANGSMDTSQNIIKWAFTWDAHTLCRAIYLLDIEDNICKWVYKYQQKHKLIADPYYPQQSQV